ncbi:cytochrome b subunit of succinate dehydrogenase, Sdh3p [Saxophila tyrrhenica]|uniref:Cytochrome b subunit of succinate dehydrogenase, Sdh3p n=1 Tax=Saxophila tyrrhenica TaxID=1690608 RepID=A0AAV9P1C3_9PEZI|nr:cytochrome b subunit of succinate dehydrogenase, Sdh3p [Saxophila tyrrhenica]
MWWQSLEGPIGTVRPDNDRILAQQRLKRPVSPFVGIYQPQIPWVLSISGRITGCLLSGGFYIFGSAYLIAPYVGWDLSIGSIVATVAAWPTPVKALVKAAVAWPFVFHCLNGLRHLTWDTSNMMTNKKVQASGWVVVGLTTVGTLILVFV